MVVLNYITIRPYVLLQGRCDVIVVVLPSYLFSSSGLFLNFIRVGEIHRRGDNISNIVLPSLNRCIFVVLRVVISFNCRGDYTGEEILVTSFSPL